MVWLVAREFDAATLATTSTAINSDRRNRRGRNVDDILFFGRERVEYRSGAGGRHLRFHLRLRCGRERLEHGGGTTGRNISRCERIEYLLLCCLLRPEREPATPPAHPEPPHHEHRHDSNNPSPHLLIIHFGSIPYYSTDRWRLSPHHPFFRFFRFWSYILGGVITNLT